MLTDHPARLNENIVPALTKVPHLLTTQIL